MTELVHASLFSGQGGFDLAAEWMNWTNAFHCENNPFCKIILNYYWPKAQSYDDITTTDFTPWRGKIDVLTGGFPCQPYSLAGKQLGKADTRHLWPHMLRAIQEIQPRWVVGENVRGLVSWNGGVVFDEVQTQLENEGYTVAPFLLPAAGVNAPHRRERIWFIAYSSKQRCDNRSDNRERGHFQKTSEWELQKDKPEWNGRQFGLSENGEVSSAFITNTCGQGLPITACGKQREIPNETNAYQGSKFSGAFATTSGWQNFPTQPPICGGNDGLPCGLEFETILKGKRLTFAKWRSEAIKAHGNSIVPQVAKQIFETIDFYELLYT